MNRIVGQIIKWAVIGFTAPGRFVLILPLALIECAETGEMDWRGIWDWTWLVGEARNV